ncbi:unnamed protein product [Rangifer tarandus platyrhynchus]|uniref:Uncharacterized protein n=1 Tax=Rangifer tarandus platyrhynchus TaxID=3082113 RepID=A0AC60A368_RANTA
MLRPAFAGSPAFSRSSVGSAGGGAGKGRGAGRARVFPLQLKVLQALLAFVPFLGWESVNRGLEMNRRVLGPPFNFFVCFFNDQSRVNSKCCTPRLGGKENPRAACNLVPANRVSRRQSLRSLFRPAPALQLFGFAPSGILSLTVKPGFRPASLNGPRKMCKQGLSPRWRKRSPPELPATWNNRVPSLACP